MILEGKEARPLGWFTLGIMLIIGVILLPLMPSEAEPMLLTSKAKKLVEQSEENSPKPVPVLTSKPRSSEVADMFQWSEFTFDLRYRGEQLEVEWNIPDGNFDLATFQLDSCESYRMRGQMLWKPVTVEAVLSGRYLFKSAVEAVRLRLKDRAGNEQSYLLNMKFAPDNNKLFGPAIPPAIPEVIKVQMSPPVFKGGLYLPFFRGTQKGKDELHKESPSLPTPDKK